MALIDIRPDRREVNCSGDSIRCSRGLFQGCHPVTSTTAAFTSSTIKQPCPFRALVIVKISTNARATPAERFYHRALPHLNMDNLDIDLEAAETAASRRISRQITSDSSVTSQSSTYDIGRHATQIESLRSANLQHIHTVGSTRTDRQSKPLPEFGAGKAYPPVIPAEREAYVVDFESPDDPLHPMNWTFKKK